MQKANSFLHRFFIIAILGILLMATVGCETIHHEAKFESDFLPKPDTRVEVGTVTNETGQTFDIDISKMFMDALNEALGKEGLLWMGGSSGEHLIITSKIVEYKKGSAFLRWLMPGLGATVLSVKCELKETTTDKIIASVKAQRSVWGGGLYTVGAWQTVLDSTAKDVVEELGSKIGR